MIDQHPTSIYIDNNVWDFLLESKIDLAVEFPKPEFALFIPREVEFEIAPAGEKIRNFAIETIARCDIETHSYFGYDDEQHSASEQRVGGFDEGYWPSEEELKFIESQNHRLGKTKRKTHLFKNEADISLAARSFDSIVLTLNNKSGPLPDAKSQGGKVIFLNNFREQPLSLHLFVMSKLKSSKK